MTSTLLTKWRCRDGVDLFADCNAALVIAIDGDPPIRLRPKTRGLAEALSRLKDGADESQMLSTAGDGDLDIARLYFYLGHLRQSGLLVAELWSDDHLMATLMPRSKHFDPVVPASQGGPWQLSRFAYLRRDGSSLVLECPEAPCVVMVQCPDLATWLCAASRPVTTEPGTAKSLVMGLLQKLAFIVDPGEEESEARQTWEFHDRLFHRQARRFDDFQPHGGTYRFRERFPSAPAIRPAHAGDPIALPKPTNRSGQSLRDAMEARRSRRDMGDHPVTRGQVAELLYRVARVHEKIETPLQECLRRPYPSGGAIHELEFYLAVGACDGLVAGFYHYRCDEHALTRLVGAESIAEEMLADCAAAWAQPDHPPQCLIVLASRLPRLAWKYEAISYKISLMNAGVVLQSLYLVCTDLGLNGSAAGSGRPELFAAATRTCTWEETSIAEFGFGSCRE